MSYNIRVTGVAIIIALIIGAAGGFIVGQNNSQDQQTKPAAVQYEVKQYTGVGSGVLKHGTLIKIKDEGGQYEGPESIVGSIDAPGTWSIREVQQ